MTRLWIRGEARATERRAPVVPEDVHVLVEAGIDVTVEASAQRAFPVEDYRAAGCDVAPEGSWVDAPSDVVVVGLKELPDHPGELRHRHVFFGHAFKGQAGARDLLDRFHSGGGTLLDLEYLTDDAGRRLAAFGYWAGYVGAALAVLHARGRLSAPLLPTTRADLDAALRVPGDPLRGLVIGALGRSGRGARDALVVAGLVPTEWDLPETANLDRAALIGHDVLVNTVLTTRPSPPFLTDADLDAPGRSLRVVSDVTCDVTSRHNVLPVNDRVTSWDEPARRLRDGERPVDVIAIDNLPSLLPVEASAAFSAELTPQLLDLDAAPWRRAVKHFHDAVKENVDA
ncbi:saccharopine dehydrogenase [Umezawaea sp.]|uniref:saccharopine dehydrogenase n=1 Tax=Umezawaea sp. TaxID=1955258 RepID=UPI002ED298E2